MNRDLPRLLARKTTRRGCLAASVGLLVSCRDSAGGWTKYDYNPVLGGNLGTCFDCCVVRFPQGYRMWFSWRPKKAIAWTDSEDGVNWLPPRLALQGLPGSVWEQEVNRPVVVPDASSGIFRMWYTGQTSAQSSIGYAESEDGMQWKRVGGGPVLQPRYGWEKQSLMAPHVNWDAEQGVYKMWYSGGDQYEPNAIGYATSSSGLQWQRPFAEPVLTADPRIPWEKDRLTGAQIAKRNGVYYAFYIGFRDIDHAAIGVARSPSGVGRWERLAANPIIRPSLVGWDQSSCYKPYAILDQGRWLLWYNGRNGNVEQIGLATHSGEGLGF